MKLLFGILTLALILLQTIPVQAAEAFPPAGDPAAVKPMEGKTPAIDIYLQNLDKKFDKGAVNFAAGWTEIIHQPRVRLKNNENKNAALKLTEGLGLGLCFAVINTVGGFLNLISSPLPQWEIPLPQGGTSPENITGGKAEGYLLPKKENDSPYPEATAAKAPVSATI